MNSNPDTTADFEFPPVQLDLKNPALAALLAWLWPGLGHLYQGRTTKGILFMVCILITYFWGLAMGDSHVVYASFRQPEVRYPFLLQVGVGIPAVPAIIHAAAPQLGNALFGEWMAPPISSGDPQVHDELATWHERLKGYFDIATLYTMVAGLLNFLVIFDAYGGPSYTDLRIKKTQRCSAAG